MRFISLHMVFRSLVVLIGMSLFSLVLVHAFEYVAPTSSFFEYRSVVPVKGEFRAWETLEFVSDVVRHRGINMQWQDALYCTDWLHKEKYPTQIIPPTGTEYVKPWTYTSLWKYSIPIEKNERECVMCGTAIWTTTHGYKKIYSYCTEPFGVNRIQSEPIDK